MNILNLLKPDKIDLVGIELIDFPSFLELLLRFTLNMTVILILVRWLYYSTTKRKDYLFTYILISTLIFLLCYLLASVKLQIGFALGCLLYTSDAADEEDSVDLGGRRI